VFNRTTAVENLSELWAMGETTSDENWRQNKFHSFENYKILYQGVKIKKEIGDMLTISFWM